MKTSAGPIVACSTCMHANAGLAVLRLSGFDSLSSLQALFKEKIAKLKPRVQTRVHLISADGHELDDVLACYFSGPNSFTGENVLELSIHGNVLHTERMLELITRDFGFALAAPGEFTLRAFKNGKLKLNQVEGLDLLLNANSAFVFEQGLSQLNGELHAQYIQLHDALKQLLASVELAIDFADDVGDDNATRLRLEHTDNVFKILKRLHARATAPIGSLLEPSIVFLGVPNAGKSTVFNYLLGDERAIVSSTAGTTRDYLSESMQLDFGRVRLIDTAGLRATSDVIEEEGVRRSLTQSGFAFMRVLVVNPFDSHALPTDELGELDLILVTHADLEGFDKKFLALKASLPINVPVVLWGHELLNGPMGAKLEGGPIGAKKISGPMGPLKSAGPIEPGTYLADPSHIISMLAGFKYDILTKNKPILIERQRHLLKRMYLEFSNFKQLSESEEDIAIIASELNRVVTQSQELIGIFTPDDVLQHIFANFCIGK